MARPFDLGLLTGATLGAPIFLLPSGLAVPLLAGLGGVALGAPSWLVVLVPIVDGHPCPHLPQQAAGPAERLGHPPPPPHRPRPGASRRAGERRWHDGAARRSCALWPVRPLYAPVSSPRDGQHEGRGARPARCCPLSARLAAQ